jgi:hypothetical protein
MTLRSFPLLASLVLAATPAAAAGIAPDAMTPDQPQVRQHPSSYRVISEEMSANLQPIFAPGGPALPVYLNRFGGTFTQGWGQLGHQPVEHHPGARRRRSRRSPAATRSGTRS